jgi:cbb3-type cytochrome c oxidase subunit I
MATRVITRVKNWIDTPDSAALHGLVSGGIWFVIGTTIGLTMSHELTLPDLFAGIPQLVFSRLRPAHVNMMLFGFLSTTFFGAWYYLVPRLCQTHLRTTRLANILLVLWNITIVVGTIALLNGDTQGKEYSEYPWYVDWAVEALLICNIVIIYRTIANRKDEPMYVSLWYIGGTVGWIAIMYAIGNVIWHPFTTTLPDGQIQSSGSLIGLNDAVWNWFYGHNVFGLYITTGGIGIVYYLVPKIVQRPIYSHTMSLIGFWTIVLMYAPTGQHHLLQAPIPGWLKVYAVIGSIGLIIPVFTQSTNIFMTMRGMWGKMIDDIALRFILTGSFFYLTVSIQGSVQSLITVNRFIHFTQWVVAHAHLALLGGFGFLSSGAMFASNCKEAIVEPQFGRLPVLADAARPDRLLLGANRRRARAGKLMG